MTQTQNLESRLNTYTPGVLSLFRIVFGLLFAMHGASKVFGWPLGTAVSAGTWPFWWAGLIELITGLLILVGLFTRIAALVASGQMAVAYFWQHQPNAFWPLGAEGGNGGEVAILYCFGFLLLVFTGGGAVAVDAMMGGQRSKTGAP